MAVSDYDEIFRDGFDEYRQFINPVNAERAQICGERVDLRRAVDGSLQDNQGRVIEDLQGTQTLGHRPAQVVAAMTRFLASDAVNWYPTRVDPFCGRLARRLYERTGYDRAYFGCTGSDGITAAMKLARARSEGGGFVATIGAYHGCGMGPVALMSPGPFRDPFGPHLAGAQRVEWDDIDGLSKLLTSGDIAAIVIEPIQVEGGVRIPSTEFIEAACQLTKAHDVLLVADEVQTGLGRTGRGFLASSTWPRLPDAVVLGKGLGGGLMPLSAMLTRAKYFDEAYGESFLTGESHNSTMGFNALSAVAGLAALECLDESFQRRCLHVGEHLRGALKARLDDSVLVVEVRGEGLITGVEFVQIEHPWLSFEHLGMPSLAGRPILAQLLCLRLNNHGFHAFTCGHDWNVLRLQPRAGIELAELTRLANVIGDELAELEEAF